MSGLILWVHVLTPQVHQVNLGGPKHQDPREQTCALRRRANTQGCWFMRCWMLLENVRLPLYMCTSNLMWKLTSWVGVQLWLGQA